MLNKKKVLVHLRLIRILCGKILAKYAEDILEATRRDKADHLRHLKQELVLANEIITIAEAISSDIKSGTESASVEPLLEITAFNIERMLYSITACRKIHPRIVAAFDDARLTLQHEAEHEPVNHEVIS